MHLLLVVSLFVAAAFDAVAAQTHDDLLGSTTSSSGKQMTHTEIFNGLMNNYDKDVRPNAGGPPVEVSVTMYVVKISSVSESNMDFFLDMYFRQWWIDPRLAFDSHLTNNGSMFISEENVRQKIWIPDTFFPTTKKTHLHMDTVPNTFTKIYPHGKVFRSMRLAITAACSMDLTHFPMDTQKCPFEIESYKYTMTDISYKWGKVKDSAAVTYEDELPNFTLIGLRVNWQHILLSNANYSRLLVDFIFQRELGFYVTRVYLPSATVVLLAWFSLWLRPGNGSTRLVLSVSSLIAMMLLMMGTVNDAVVKVSYVTGLDIYLFSCFLLVVATLGESIVVDFLEKRDSKKGKKILDLPESETDTKLSTGERVDKFGRIILLVVFILFNFLYWVIYLNVGELPKDMIPILD